MLYMEINKGSHRTVSYQVYENIRTGIVKRKLSPGERLPSTRALAQELSISRGTVCTAYEMLEADGYTRPVPGSGYYVSELGGERNTSAAAPRPCAYDSLGNPDDVSRITFSSGTAALELFPRERFRHILNSTMKTAPDSALGYDDPSGRPELKESLCRYLARSRGIECSASQILITSGTKQSLSLIAHCMLTSDSVVWSEDPTNRNIVDIFSYYAKRIVPIPVDEEGIVTDALPSGSPDLLFVTPSRQYPLGGILSAARREQLAARCTDNGFFIAEDDYDGSFRYDGYPAKSLFELAPNNVLFMGTFSKTMFPSMRLGYIVLPPELVECLSRQKRLFDHHSNSLFQLALCEFIESGEYERHIARMRKRYSEMRASLLHSLYDTFKDRVSVFGSAAGMHIVAAFEGIDFNDAVLKKIAESGVFVVPVEHHCIVKGNHRDQIILGFSHLDPERQREGLHLLFSALYG